jgi:hypothetical protein
VRSEDDAAAALQAVKAAYATGGCGECGAQQRVHPHGRERGREAAPDPAQSTGAPNHSPQPPEPSQVTVVNFKPGVYALSLPGAHTAASARANPNVV